MCDVISALWIFCSGSNRRICFSSWSSPWSLRLVLLLKTIRMFRSWSTTQTILDWAVTTSRKFTICSTSYRFWYFIQYLILFLFTDGKLPMEASMKSRVNWGMKEPRMSPYQSRDSTPGWGLTTCYTPSRTSLMKTDSSPRSSKDPAALFPPLWLHHS